MITIFRYDDKQFLPIEKAGKDCWVNVANPDRSELDKVSREYDIPLDFLKDSLDIDERSRIETDNNTIIIVLRIPKLNDDNSNFPFSTLPVGIILKDEIILTVCSDDISVLLEIFTRRIKIENSESRYRFILSLFNRTVHLYLRYLKEINKMSSSAEVELQKAMKNEELIKLLNIEKSLVFFTTSLRSNELMMERLEKIKAINLHENDIDLLEDIIIDNRQAIEMANIHSNILSGMMDAFASVISNNLNVVLKLLTSVTIILMLPTLVASIYGMNVELPFQHSPHAFLIPLGLSIILSVIGVIVFLKNNWF